MKSRYWFLKGRGQQILDLKLHGQTPLILIAFSVRNTIKGSKLWKNGRNIKGDFHFHFGVPFDVHLVSIWCQMEVSFNVAPIFSQFTALDCIPDTKSYQQAFFRACNPTFGHVMTYLVIKSMPAFHLHHQCLIDGSNFSILTISFR